MDAQYKIITKTAHLITKESSQEEANEMFATMSGLKEQLTKVGKYFNAGTLWGINTATSSVTQGQIIHLLKIMPFVSSCDLDLVALSSSKYVMSFKNEMQG